MAQIEGTRLGNYDLLQRIGAGGMAEVYHARQRNAFGRDVAIKIIRRSLTEQEDFRTRFLREGQTTARLTHPHILPLIEVGEEGDTLFLVMPYVAGGTLRELLARTKGPLPLPMVAGYLSQLCEAIQYAHERGLVHRDIKPSNILLYNERHVLLADFGIALDTQEARLTSTGLGLGTPEYMAPEQARGFVEARSDLYSLGIVLFEMLTGRVPFTGRTAFDVFLQHTSAPIPRLRDCLPTLPIEPDALDACLQRALAKDPTQRFENAVDLNAAVQHALSGSIAQTHTTGALRPLRLQPAPEAQMSLDAFALDTPREQASAVPEQPLSALGEAPLFAAPAASASGGDGPAAWNGALPTPSNLMPAPPAGAPAAFAPFAFQDNGYDSYQEDVVGGDPSDEEADPSGEGPTLAAAPFTRQSQFSGGYPVTAPHRRARLLWLITCLLLLALGIGTFALAAALFSTPGASPSAGSPTARSTLPAHQTQQPSPTLVPSPTATLLPSPTATPLPAQLSVTPASLTFFVNPVFCNNTPAQSLTIQNTGSGELTWQTTIQGKHLAITPTSGRLGANQTSKMKVSVTCSHIGSQTIHDQILFTSNGGSAAVQVTIFIA